MAALIQFFFGSFASLFTVMGAKVTAKFGIQLALVAVFVSAALVFATALNTLGSALVGTMPSIVQQGFTYLPTNIDLCVSAIIGGETAAYVYRQIVIVASIKSRV